MCRSRERMSLVNSLGDNPGVRKEAPLSSQEPFLASSIKERMDGSKDGAYQGQRSPITGITYVQGNGVITRHPGGWGDCGKQDGRNHLDPREPRPQFSCQNCR